VSFSFDPLLFSPFRLFFFELIESSVSDPPFSAPSIFSSWLIVKVGLSFFSARWLPAAFDGVFFFPPRFRNQLFFFFLSY